MDGVALCRGRSVVRRRTELLPSFCPKATSFNILARSFCSFPVLLPSLFSLPTLLTILFPSTQYLKPATRWNFNTISFGSRWQTHLSLFLSLSFPYSLSFRATSPSQSLLYCLLKTIYNLNPPWSIGGKCSLFPANGTRANRIASYSRRTLIICWSISAAFVEFGNYPIMFLGDEGCLNWG